MRTLILVKNREEAMRFCLDAYHTIETLYHKYRCCTRVLNRAKACQDAVVGSPDKAVQPRAECVT